MPIQLHDEIADLFEFDGNRILMLREKYKVAVAGDEVNAILATINIAGRNIPRIEVLCVDSSEQLMVIVDSVITVSVHMTGFEQFAAFLGQLALPLNGG